MYNIHLHIYMYKKQHPHCTHMYRRDALGVTSDLLYLSSAPGLSPPTRTSLTVEGVEPTRAREWGRKGEQESDGGGGVGKGERGWRSVYGLTHVHNSIGHKHRTYTIPQNVALL